MLEKRQSSKDAGIVVMPALLAAEGCSAIERPNRVRGRAATPHPFVHIESLALPSPTRGEGTNTAPYFLDGRTTARPARWKTSRPRRSGWAL